MIEKIKKKFHNDQASTISLKSNANSLINPEDIPKQTSKCSKLSSCCCSCFRKSTSPRSSLPHLSSSNHGPNIDHKQNGYLIYRFTNNSSNNNTSTYGSHPNSPVTTPPTNSKRSIFCRPCANSKKKMAHLPDEVYQYRRNYTGHPTAEYQFRNDESPCYELKTLENSLSTVTKCQTQSAASKIRDLNTELSHSRQLKAAAVAAAAVSPTTKEPSKENVRLTN